MLQLSKPHDFVIGTGKTHSVKDFLQIAFSSLNLDNKKYNKIYKSIMRPNYKVILKADFSKAKKILKWKPRISFKSLVIEMVDHDLKNS